MNEHIKTAQAIAELPKEAGCDRWPWLFGYFYADYEVMDKHRDKKQIESNLFDSIAPWLAIDDFSPWSAAKWLERATGVPELKLKLLLSPEDWPFYPSNLDYMKAILAIGQRAFGTGEWETGFQEERQPWLEAWERGQNINQAE
jgi:hypothetical protein